MSYKYDKPKEGESLGDYLRRHKAHPTQKDRLKATDDDLKKGGNLPPDDHSIYTEGHGIGITRKGK